jgi:hypothetical protein
MGWRKYSVFPKPTPVATMREIGSFEHAALFSEEAVE